MNGSRYVQVSVDFAVVKFDLEHVMRLVVANGRDAGRADAVALHVLCIPPGGLAVERPRFTRAENLDFYLADLTVRFERARHGVSWARARTVLVA